jgi:hypothetical protein
MDTAILYEDEPDRDRLAILEGNIEDFDILVGDARVALERAVKVFQDVVAERDRAVKTWQAAITTMADASRQEVA